MMETFADIKQHSMRAGCSLATLENEVKKISGRAQHLAPIMFYFSVLLLFLKLRQMATAPASFHNVYQKNIEEKKPLKSKVFMK